MGWVGAIVRFIVAALVLMLMGYIVPGFSHLGFGYALVAALVISIVGWVLESLFGRGVSPYSRGLVGFLVSAAVIWITQFFVPTMHVSILGALIAAFIIGLVDMFVPTSIR